ncbi:hypothetical protein MJK72_14065 [Klebsiella pneumoniae]|nr:hypothetical protein MJK72_14065 [Klebsiella pneumoniae]
MSAGGAEKPTLIAWPIVAQGPEAVAAALAAVNDPAVRYVVLDALGWAGSAPPRAWRCGR